VVALVVNEPQFAAAAQPERAKMNNLP
jgi:hypothetical protein